MNQWVKGICIALLLIVSIQFAFSVGRCVDEASFLCIEAEAEDASACVGQYDRFIDGVVCAAEARAGGGDAWANTPVPPLPDSGCCCVSYTDSIGEVYNRSEVVANRGVCEEAIPGRISSLFITQSLDESLSATNADHCPLLCGETVRSEYTRYADSCEGQGHVVCSRTQAAALVDGISNLPLFDLTVNTNEFVCVAIGQCTIETQSCDDLVSVGSYEYCGASQTCESGFGIGSGGSECCQKNKCVGATCQQKGGIYCERPDLSNPGCASPALNIDALIGNSTGKPAGVASECCLGTQTSQSCFQAGQCQATGTREIDCRNGIDDDCDGYIDSYDSQCGGSVYGYITSAVTGVGAGEGMVVNVRNQETTKIAQGITDKDGYYTAYGLETEGDFRVYLDGNYVTNSGFAALTDDAISARVDLDIEAGNGLSTIRGNVTSETGEGLIGALVVVRGTSRYGRTDSNGTYEIKGVPYGTYDIEAFYSSYDSVTVSKTVQIREFSLHFKLPSAACGEHPEVYEISGLLPVKGEKQVKVRWAADRCADSVSSFQIFRSCVAGSGDCGADATPISVGVALDRADREFIDKDPTLVWENTYEYTVAARYDSSGGFPQVSAPKQITLGSALCEGIYADRDAGFCKSLGPQNGLDFVFVGGVLCDADNRITLMSGDQSCDPISETCINTENGPSCIAKDFCGENTALNPFGLFSERSLCQEKADGCYYDRKSSNVDSCITCETDMTCFDYKTIGACVGTDVLVDTFGTVFRPRNPDSLDKSISGNICDVASRGSSCEWRVVDTALKTGVCVDRKASTCDSCNSGNSLYGFCDAFTCSQLSGSQSGDTCFLSESNSFCNSCEQTTCYDYDNQASCNTNTCGAPSCNFNGKCFRDSGNSVHQPDNQDDCSASNELPLDTSVLSTSACRRDRIAPQTFVLVPEQLAADAGDNSKIFFAVVDIGTEVLNGSPHKETRFCIENAGAESCTDSNNYESTNESFVYVTSDLLSNFVAGEGDLTLFYYSIDHANNIEEVNSTGFALDLSGPGVAGLTYDEFYNPQTKLSIINAVLITAEHAECSLQVDKGTGYLNPSVSPAGFSKEHVYIFNGLEAGVYKAKIVCNDQLGNSITDTSYSIFIEGAGKIGNFKPFGVTDISPITLEITTEAGLDCRVRRSITAGDQKSYAAIGSSGDADEVIVNGQFLIHKFYEGAFSTGTFAYQFACINDEDEYVAYNVFTYDDINPEIRALDASGEFTYNFSKWKNTHSFSLRCSDEPEGGFGCGTIYYCDVQKPAYDTTVGSCEPNLVYNPATALTYEEPHTVCWKGVEKTNGIFSRGETGKESEVTCMALRVDGSLPQLELDDPKPQSTGSQYVAVSGRVTDGAFSLSTVQLNSVSLREKTYDSGVSKFQDFEFAGTAILGFEGVQEPTFDIIFRNTSTERYILRVETPRISQSGGRVSSHATAYLYYQSGAYSKNGNMQELTKSDLIGYNVDTIHEQPFDFTVRAEGSAIFTKITQGGLGPVELTATHSGPSAGSVGFVAFESEELPAVNINGISVVDLSVSEYDIYFRIKQVGSDSSEIRPSIRADPTFSTLVRLTDASLSHGDTFVVDVWAENLVGIKTREQTLRIVYDTGAPIITDIQFESLISDSDEIEYGKSAKTYITFDDDNLSFIQELVLKIGDIEREVFLDYSKLNPAEGVFTTAGVSTGTHDVTVMARDSAGNYVEKTFLNRLRIKIAPGWPAIMQDNPYHVRNTRPEISVNFSYVGVDPAIRKDIDSCVLRYKAADGNYHENAFVQQVDGSYLAKPSHDLAGAPRSEIKTYAIVLCRSGSEELGYGQTIVVDNIDPVIGIDFLDKGAVLVDVEFEKKEWDLNRNTLFSDSEMLLYASEPVVCKIYNIKANGDKDVLYGRDFGRPFFESTHVDSFTIGAVDNLASYIGSYDRQIECTDRAGRKTDSDKGLFTINILGNDPMSLLDIKPGKYSSNLETVFSVRTVPDATCSIGIDSSTVSMNKQGEFGTSQIHAYEHSYVKNFPIDGIYSYEITCTLGNITSVYTETLLVDTKNPTVTFTQSLPGETTSRILNDVSGTIDEESTVVAILNGREVYRNENTTSFNFKLSLVEGDNNIDFIVTDLAGNEVRYSRITQRTNAGATYIRFLGYANDVYPSIPEIQAMVFYPKQSVRYELTITGESEIISPDAVSVVINDIVTFNTANLDLDDGDYNLKVEAINTSDGKLLSADYGHIEINHLAPDNVITQPGAYVEEAVELITGYTDNFELNTYIRRDTIYVNSSLRELGGTTFTQNLYSPYRFFANVSYPNKYDEGEHYVVFESENDLEILGRASQLAIYDERGPRVSVDVLGMDADNIVYTKRPTFDITFHEAAKFLRDDTYIKDSDGQIYDLDIDLGSDGYYTTITTGLRPNTRLVDDSTYTIHVRGEDQYGNKGSTSAIVSFTVESGPPRFVEWLNPSWGVTVNATDLFSIKIDRPAICFYDKYNSPTDTAHKNIGDMKPFTQTGGLIHSQNLSFTSAEQRYYVKCRAGEGEVNVEPLKEFILQQVTTPPAIKTPIKVEGSNNGVISDRTINQPVITVKTTQRTICKYSTTQDADFEFMRDFGIQTELEHDHTARLAVGDGDNKFFFKCMNGAELISPEKSVSVKVDYTSGESFQIISPTHTNDDNVTVKIKSEKALDLSACSFSVTGSDATSFTSVTSDGFYLTSDSITYPNEGEYEVNVTCYYTADNIQERSDTFFIDRTAPTFVAILTPDVTQLSDRLRAQFEFEDNLSGLNQYQYHVGTAVFPDLGYDSVVFDRVTRDKDPEVKGVSLEDGALYYWSVKAYDKAGNPSVQFYSSNGTLVNLPSTGGGPVGPSCGNGLRDGDESDVDCGGSCLTKCPVASVCAVDNDCTSLSCSGLLCQAPTCTDQRKNGFEAGVDCGGGTCNLCANGVSCQQNQDCISGTCDVGICVEITCINGVQDNDESDVDCGGSCGACSEGRACILDSDCADGLCANNQCADPQTHDSDGDGLPDRWEDENGLDKNDPNDADLDIDQDGLTNKQEYDYKFTSTKGLSTNPQREDTDGDGVNDYKEVVKDNTDPHNENDFKKAFSWALWLLLFIMLLVLSLGGYYGYTVYDDDKKKVKNRPTQQQYRPMPRPVVPIRSKVSLHDQLKKALEERLAQEKRMANSGHPVFESDLKSPTDKNTVEETITEETIEEKSTAKKAKKKTSSKKSKPSASPKSGSALKKLGGMVKGSDPKTTPKAASKTDTLAKLKKIGKK